MTFINPIIENEIGFLMRDVTTPDRPIAPPDRDKTVCAEPPARNQINAKIAVKILNKDLPGDNCFSISTYNFSSYDSSGIFSMFSLSIDLLQI